MILFAASLFLLLELAAGEFVIVATTDLHARFDAMRRLAPLIEAARGNEGLLVDLGDTVQGAFEGGFRHGKLPLAWLNAMRYDFWVPGNHDFEIRPFRFAEFRGTVLGANWRTPDFTPVPWQLISRGGVRLAVIGLTEQQIPYRLLPGDPVEVTRQADALDRLMPEVRRARPDFIVLLRHDGLYGRGGNLHALLKRYPEIDLVLGGHTHVEIPGERVGRSFYVQAGKHGEAFAVIRVEVKSGRRPRIRAELVRPEPDAPLPPLADHLAELAGAARSAGDEIAGFLPEPWREPDGPLFTDTPLGRATARAMLETGGAAVAIANRSLGRRTFAGPLTRRQLFQLFPFENRIVTVELTPAELEETIETEVALLKKGRRAAIFAGVTLELDHRGRLTRLELPEPDPDGRIRVAMTDYAAAGAGGLAMTPRHAIDRGAPRHDSGTLLRDAVAARLAAAGPGGKDKTF